MLQAGIGVVIALRAPPVPCAWIVLTPADNSAQEAPDAASHINLLRSPFIRVSSAGICPFLAAGLIPYCRYGEASKHSQKARQNPEIQGTKF
jgi:hypothetical protein